MNLKLERARLFDRYASNFTLYRPQYQNVFICPLCLNGFDRLALDNDLLTVEHCVPESVGGSILTLTCKKCNNEDGTRVDSHLSERLRSDDFAEGVGQGPYDSDISIEGNRMKSNVIFGRDQGHAIDIQIVQRATDLRGKVRRPALKELSSGREGIQGSMSFAFKFSHHVARVAMMRAAYLTMFRYYGYSYIFYKELALVRTQIRNPKEAIIPQEAVLQLPVGPCRPNIPVIVTSPVRLPKLSRADQGRVDPPLTHFRSIPPRVRGRRGRTLYRN